MKKLCNRLFMIVAMILYSATSFGQGATTSTVNGRVLSGSEALNGANVVAIHQPTGSQYGTITDEDGYYSIPSMEIGGPYKITITFIGFENYEKSNVYLTLGQTFKLIADLKQKSIDVSEVVITGSKSDVIDGNRTGSETIIDENSISKLPTISRSLNDFTRITPQAMLVGGGISLAGVNNRFNSIFIDGAVNNDVFGLSSSGTNGGQLGITPISIDAIEQFQVVLAPYDVRQGGFAGGGINAVTRRGTNQFEGSVYYLMRNENFAGVTPTDVEDATRTKLAAFTANTMGARVGGPIIKDKLFFFINAEMQREETPRPFNFADYTGNMKGKLDSVNMITNKLKELGYDPGTCLSNNQTTNSDKFLISLDYNISQNHKLTLRHHYTKGNSIYPYNPASNKTNLTYYNNWINFNSVTNSTALEFKSRLGARFSNDLILGYTSVKDDRDPNGSNFPIVLIKDGAGRIFFGSEEYSSANELNQGILTLTDNFNVYLGAHTITLGTHIEFYDMYNLFIRQNFGRYEFNSVADFLGGKNATYYSRSYSLVDNVIGDGSAAAAEFNAAQLGFYLQDEFQIGANIKVTAGIRADIPLFMDQPPSIAQFDTTMAKLTAAGYDMQGAESGKMPASKIMLSPRVGFNWDLFGDQTTQVRGGIGIFTSRIPFVWPAGSFTNNGLVVGGFSKSGSIAFRPDYENQYRAEDLGATIKTPSGQIDLFAKDFKYPQVFRTSLGVDRKLPWGIVGTLDVMFTKTLNNVLYYNMNVKPSTQHLTGTPDTRPIFSGYSSSSLIEKTYSGIYLGTNTSDGYSYNVTVQLQKPFSNGFSANVAYTFGESKSMNDGTSSQNSSQWLYVPSVNGHNALDLAYSDFDMGHRVQAFVSYQIEYLKHAATTISLYYNGQSGDRYSYCYLYGNKMTNEANADQDLIFVPASQNDIKLIDYTYKGSNNQNVTVTAAEQWAALDKFIESDEYLKANRGKYTERNGARTGFEHNLDLRIVQDLFVEVASKRHTIQITLDIFNFANLLNKDWGRKYYIGYTYNLLRFEKFDATDKTMPLFTYRRMQEAGIEKVDDIYNISDSGIGSSRWFGQLGVRYFF